LFVLINLFQITLMISFISNKDFIFLEFIKLTKKISNHRFGCILLGLIYTVILFLAFIGFVYLFLIIGSYQTFTVCITLCILPILLLISWILYKDYFELFHKIHPLIVFILFPILLLDIEGKDFYKNLKILCIFSFTLGIVLFSLVLFNDMDWKILILPFIFIFSSREGSIY